MTLTTILIITLHSVLLAITTVLYICYFHNCVYCLDIVKKTKKPKILSKHLNFIRLKTLRENSNFALILIAQSISVLVMIPLSLNITVKFAEKYYSFTNQEIQFLINQSFTIFMILIVTPLIVSEVKLLKGLNI